MTEIYYFPANATKFALDSETIIGYNIKNSTILPNKYGRIFNFIRRNRLAVWRQLPKLIPAGSTPVSCST